MRPNDHLLRLGAGALHLLLAAFFVSGGLALVAQARMNLRWEAAFYGDISVGSVLMLMLGFSAMGMAAVAATTATAYAATGHRILGHLTLMGSVFLFLAVPGFLEPWGDGIAWLSRPASFVAGLAAVAVILDLWPRPGELAPEDPDG